ncbi:MAG: BMC domain-containing protein [Deltaproteobacteria bacterium]|nr:BMC domain-containing protein [Deltaproteobacteria bacterium]MBW2024543.1 BMC domain-containing protein [Deltaproteobacteria bacterium]MBW2124740.1 BMC domain-containing protein [Deltaproteobacteria bacterium]
MAVNIQLITHPSHGVIEILMSRVGPVGRKLIEQIEFSAVGLVQGRLTDMIYAADIAEKAADVRVFDLKGTCPQHLTMIGIFGDIAAVKAALEAIKADESL